MVWIDRVLIRRCSEMEKDEQGGLAGLESQLRTKKRAGRLAILSVCLSGIPSISSKQLVIGVRELARVPGYPAHYGTASQPAWAHPVWAHTTRPHTGSGPERACFLLGFLQGSSDGWPPNGTSD